MTNPFPDHIVFDLLNMEHMRAGRAQALRMLEQNANTPIQRPAWGMTYVHSGLPAMQRQATRGV